MKGEKRLFISLFIFVVVISGIIFGAEVAITYRQIDKASSSGQVAGDNTQFVQRRVEFNIDNGKEKESFVVGIYKGEKVLTVIKRLEKEGKIKVSLKTYDFGTLLEGINGVKNGTEGKYWLYYLNGQMPMLGIDSQEVKAGDKIEFKFEKSPF